MGSFVLAYLCAFFNQQMGNGMILKTATMRRVCTEEQICRTCKTWQFSNVLFPPCQFNKISDTLIQCHKKNIYTI